MLFIINAEGTVQKTFPSQVYQGSNDASDIIVLAPIVQAAMADVGFMLPNGAWTTPYIMASNSPIELEGVSYNTWRTLLPYAITEYSGMVTAQFRFYTGAGADPQTAQVITTAATTFAVQTGAAIQLPDAPTDDVYEQILAALTNVNSDISKLREDTDAKVPLAGNGDAQRAYTAAPNGSTVMVPISTGADADTLAMRKANGAVEVSEPADDADAVNLGYLKQNGYALAQETGQRTDVAMSQKATTDELEKKLNREPAKSSEAAYVELTGGETFLRVVTANATANTIAKRNNNGSLSAKDPINNDDLVTLGYFNKKQSVCFATTTIILPNISHPEDDRYFNQTNYPNFIIGDRVPFREAEFLGGILEITAKSGSNNTYSWKVVAEFDVRANLIFVCPISAGETYPTVPTGLYTLSYDTSPPPFGSGLKLLVGLSST